MLVVWHCHCSRYFCCRCDSISRCVCGMIFLPLTFKAFIRFVWESPQKKWWIIKANKSVLINERNTIEWTKQNVNNDLFMCIHVWVYVWFALVGLGATTLHKLTIFLSSLEQKFVNEVKCVTWQFAAACQKSIYPILYSICYYLRIW